MSINFNTYINSENITKYPSTFPLLVVNRKRSYFILQLTMFKSTMKSLFEVNTICRLCLRADEKVSRLNNTDQKDFIESIIKLKQDNYVPTDDLYVCYTCKALLTKSFNFMQTIWSAQKIICDILKKTNMVTKQQLYCIDRHNNGLNPITLSYVITFRDNVKGYSSNVTPWDSTANTNTDIKELDLDPLIKKNIPIRQRETHKKKPNININNYHYINKHKLSISISDEDGKSSKCNQYETKVEICDNFGIEASKESSYPLAMELNTNEPIPETKKTVTKENKSLKKNISISGEDGKSGKGNQYDTKIEICDNFGIDAIKAGEESSDPLTMESNTDQPIPETKKTVLKENKGLKKNISISAEDANSCECNQYDTEIEICDNFGIDAIKVGEESSDPLTMESNTDQPIPETKKTVLKENKSLKKYISISAEDANSCECNQYDTEIEICDNFGIDAIKAGEESSDPLTMESNTDQLETKKTVLKENKGLKKIISISDEDGESGKSNKDDTKVEIWDNLGIKTVNVSKESSDPLTMESNTNEPIPETKKSFIKKKKGLKKRPSFLSDSDDSTSNNSQKKRVKKEDIDDDYQPDSTSHSEDSDYDSYDDEGKKIKRPKDNRVFPMQCDHCDFEVLEKCDHYRHYQWMHPNIEFPYKSIKDYACSICGKLYTKQRIGTHEAGHTLLKLKCYFCPKVFHSQKKRLSHVKGVHPKKTLTCDYCSKTFKTRTEITRHIRTHTGIKPFKCHICGDAFAHSGNRSIHIRAKHQNNYNYVTKKKNRAQKVRRNKKNDSTDTEIACNSEKTIRKTKTNNQSENTKKKQRSNSKEKCGTDTAMVSAGGKKQHQKKKKKETKILSDMNVKQGSKNNENADIESDDEILAVIKRKNT